MPITKGIAIVIVLTALDRATKTMALFFDVHTLTFNPRAFFFFDSSLLSFGMLVMLALALGVWFFSERSLASAIVFAGVLGNAYDRVSFDAIIDWISVPGISVFNLADAFIVVGCAMVVVSVVKRKQIE